MTCPGSLDKTKYTWNNALGWGLFSEHCKQARTGSFGNRLIHIVLAAVEFLPIISQIVSIAEKLIVTKCINKDKEVALPNEPDARKKTIKIQPGKENDKEVKKVAQVQKIVPPAPVKVEPAEVAQVSMTEYKRVIDATSQFRGYGITLPENHPCTGVVLTGLNLRPSNFFFTSLFEDSKESITTTLPQDTELFKFNRPHQEIRDYLDEKAIKDPNSIVTVEVKDRWGVARINREKGMEKEDVKLADIYGDKSYQMSMKEIMDTLESQRIYTSSLLPVPFYSGLKKAMKADNIVVLPGDDANPILLKNLVNPHIQDFINKVKLDPLKYGFENVDQFNDLLNMTIYQIGSMVVKSEDYRTFIDGDGKIMAREPGKKDNIRLINACGIRGFHSEKTPKAYNQMIMKETFKTSLKAANEGIVVFPAVGMGVWRGDPHLYWTAFLDAILESENNFDLICVNPRHQPTHGGAYDKKAGEEFQAFLDQAKETFKDNPDKLEKLNKIVNLYDEQTDLVQLAHNFKVSYPDKIVSLFNASDPDVTLGYHVGEYVNNWPHTLTTEENYTAMGTNGLCFEGITKIHEHPERISQVK